MNEVNEKKKPFGPIIRVEPMQGCVLRVVFDNGNSVTVDFSPRLKTFRFGILKDETVWRTADTDSVFVHWHQSGLNVVEVAYDEIMKMALGEGY